MMGTVQIISRRAMIFKTLSLGAGALGLALGCSSGVKQAPSVQSPQKIQAAQDKPLLVHYSSLTDAVSSLLSKGPKVLAFGEIHKRAHTGLVSTLSRFTREALPLLYTNGYKDYICEFIPGDEEMDAEIEHFIKTGEIKPYLMESFDRHSDCGGVMEFLNAAKGLESIGIHGSNLSKQERAHLIFLEKEAERINQKTLEMIKQLLDKDQKVVVYSGIQHNNLGHLPGEDIFSFGHTLKKEIGSGYVEVDLILSDLIQKIGPANIGIEDLEGPKEGVDLYTFSNGRKVMVLPSAEPKAGPIPPLPIENCILP